MKAINKYFEELRKNPQEDILVENTLFLKAQSGCTTSRDIIFNKYALFAADQAKKLQYKKHEQDLIQEANIGLLKAIQLYDPSRNAKFMSFAVWHIKGAINIWLTNHSRTIRLPANVINQILAGKDDYANYATAQSGDVFAPEILDNTNMSSYTDLDFDEESKVAQLISFLPKQTQEIILLRIGDEAPSWETIGSKFKINRETARTIFNNAVKKIVKKYGKEKILNFFL